MSTTITISHLFGAAGKKVRSINYVHKRKFQKTETVMFEDAKTAYSGVIREIP